MPAIDVVVESGIDLSVRARQVCGMFDCPPEKKQRLQWKANLPLDEKEWSIGLIVGPSGSGKSTCARHLWPDEYEYGPKWSGDTVIDSFDSSISIESIAAALNSVGFSTIPAWIRPYHVLSNGEQFRADIAKRMLEQEGVVVIDEFTSVVDRQVAKIACHSVQKFIRRQNRQLVAVTCHNDVVDWLQPDWVFEPAERQFRWREVQRRPSIHIEVARVPNKAWRIFAPYHYMSADLNPGASSFGLWANGELAAFAGVIHKPHPKAKNIKGLSRLVTLPDYQGLGLGFVLSETLGAAYKATGSRFRNYPAHPSFIRAYRQTAWKCVKRPGNMTPQKAGIQRFNKARPCAVMEYIGPAMEDEDAATRLIRGETIPAVPDCTAQGAQGERARTASSSMGLSQADHHHE